MKVPKDIKNKKKQPFKNYEEFENFHTRPDIFAYTSELEQEFERLRIFGDERDLDMIQKCENTSKIMCIIPKKSLTPSQELEWDLDVSKIDLDNYRPICANCLKKTNEYFRYIRANHSKEFIQEFKETIKIHDPKVNKEIREELRETIPFIKIGDHVKVEFKSLDNNYEYMWFEVKKIYSNSRYLGILLNKPVFVHDSSIRKGNILTFSQSQIYDIEFKH